MKQGYVCNRHRWLKISMGKGRMIEFREGLYETEDPDEQAQIERVMDNNGIVFRDLPESPVPEPLDVPTEVAKEPAPGRDASTILGLVEGVVHGGKGTEHQKGERNK